MFSKKSTLKLFFFGGSVGHDVAKKTLPYSPR